MATTALKNPADLKPAAEIAPGNVPALPKGQKVGQSLDLYGGRVMPQTFGQVIEFAQMMCKGGLAIPKHLRDQPGTCMAVIQRSLAWEMDPWAVATKTYAVNDVLAYEAQLIAAVLKKWAPVKEKVWTPKFTGEGGKRKCSYLLHHIETGEEIFYESPEFDKIQPKNSPLWKTDPDQQQSFYSIRALGRRHFSDIILGVYDREEALAMARDITPKNGGQNFLEDDEPAQPRGEVEIIEPEQKPRPADPIEAEIERAHEINDELVREEPEHDAETGEILDPAPTRAEILFANLFGDVKASHDESSLAKAEREAQKRMDELPADLRKQLRQAIFEKNNEIGML